MSRYDFSYSNLRSSLSYFFESVLIDISIILKSLFCSRWISSIFFVNPTIYFYKFFILISFSRLTWFSLSISFIKSEKFPFDCWLEFKLICILYLISFNCLIYNSLSSSWWVLFCINELNSKMWFSFYLKTILILSSSSVKWLILFSKSLCLIEY